MKRQCIATALTIASILSLAACSSTTSSSDDNEGGFFSNLKIVLSYDKLPVCNDDNEDAFYYVKNDNAVYTCLSGKWFKKKGVDYQVNVCDMSQYDPAKESCYNDKDIVKGNCDKDSQGNILQGESGQKYTCVNVSEDSTKIRPITIIEEEIKTECNAKNKGKTAKFGYSSYVCDAEKGWQYDYENLQYDSIKYGDRTYKTVGIGKQMWMAENLYYTDTTVFPNLAGGYTCYDKTDESCEKYGAYYTWTAAMNLPASYMDSIAGSKLKGNHRGICPEGWHIPSVDDWDMLNEFVIGTNDMDEEAGPGLKATTSWKVDSTSNINGNGTNAYGFNAYATGNVKANGTPDQMGIFAIFWVADEIECTYDYVDSGKCRDFLTPVRADLRYDKISLRYLQSDSYERSSYLSIRCVSDVVK